MNCKAVKFNSQSINKLAYEAAPDYLPSLPHLRASMTGYMKQVK